jgi:phosphatidylserine synthase
MTTANFLQRARDALVPMRTAAMDALLLTAFIYIGLFIFPAILLSYPWLVLPIYALAYLLTVILRLRQAARETTEPRSPYNYLFH